MLASDFPIKIVNNLYLGDFKSAIYSNLSKNDISAVVCLTSDCHDYQGDIILLHIDDISENLDEDSFTIDKLIKAVEFINDHINRGDNVLVHCKAGSSRSPTAIIAYIMQSNKLNVNDSLYFVQQRATHINPTFISLLEKYYEYLQHLL